MTTIQTKEVDNKLFSEGKDWIIRPDPAGFSFESERSDNWERVAYKDSKTGKWVDASKPVEETKLVFESDGLVFYGNPSLSDECYLLGDNIYYPASVTLSGDHLGLTLNRAEFPDMIHARIVYPEY